MMEPTLNDAIASQLLRLRESKGSLTMDDVCGMLENIAAGFKNENSAADSFLRGEILKIARHIEATKRELAALAPQEGDGAAIGSAAVQLDAVVKATEEAAGAIMDAADEIQNLVSGAVIDANLKDRIMAVTSRIYEACNFQDLTGQRIKKVMRALDFTEARLQRLVGLFASDGSLDMAELKKVVAETGDPLLNGPQLPGSAPSQADIDSLFANLK